MSTLIIFLDANKRVFHKITPAHQGPGYSENDRFDGQWGKLVEHFYGEHKRNRGEVKRYHSYEVK